MIILEGKYVLASFLFALTRYLTEQLMEGEFILACSLRMQAIMAGKAEHLECKAASHIMSTESR